MDLQKGTKNVKSLQFKHIESGNWASSIKSSLATRLLVHIIHENILYGTSTANRYNSHVALIRNI